MRAILVALAVVVFATPAMADAKADAIAACGAYLLKADSVPLAVSSGFTASGSGERFKVEGRARYNGRENVRVRCDTNKGRVTKVAWG